MDTPEEQQKLEIESQQEPTLKTNTFEAAMWPALSGRNDDDLEEGIETFQKVAADANTAICSFLSEQFRRELADILPISAAWVRVERVGTHAIDEIPEEIGPHDEIFAVWEVFDDSANELDEEDWDDVAEVESVLYFGADLAGLHPAASMLLKLEEGVWYDGRTGESAPWCKKIENLDEQLLSALGESPASQFMEEFLDGVLGNAGNEN